MLGNNNTLPTTTAVIIGAPTSAAATLATGNLNLQTFNQTLVGLTVNADVATTNNINIGGGSLTVNIPASSSVVFGANLSGADVTNVTFTGGGTLNVVGANTTNTTFTVGNPFGPNKNGNIDTATADFTGLAQAIFSVGTFRVGDFDSIRTALAPMSESTRCRWPRPARSSPPCCRSAAIPGSTAT